MISSGLLHRVLSKFYASVTKSYPFRRSDSPAPESAPPLSSIISQPAEVFGIDRSAEPLSFPLRTVFPRVVALVSAGAIVLGRVVVWFCAVIVPLVVAGDCVVLALGEVA